MEWEEWDAEMAVGWWSSCKKSWRGVAWLGVGSMSVRSRGVGDEVKGDVT